MLQILIIDDDELFGQTLAARLGREQEGGTPRFVAKAVITPGEALAMAKSSQNGFDVMLIDVNLNSEMDGIELMQRLKEICPDSDAIVFTGYDDEISGIRAFQSGAFRYIEKPFAVRELIWMLRAIEQHQNVRREHKLQLLLSRTVVNTGKSWVVLIGIDHYDDPAIPNLSVCSADVSAIQESIGEVLGASKLLTDTSQGSLPTRSNILGELSLVAESCQEDDLLLFYFSGHGVAEAGESYLLPRDARIAALKHTGISMCSVRELMDASAARAKVIILDACHSGAAIGKAETVMTEEFIRRVFEEAEGMVVLASCKQGQKSWEWPEQGRSVFTYYLLEALSGKADFNNKGFVTVSDVNRFVSNGVRRWAAEHGVPQTPTLQSSVAGDIVLVRYA